MGEDGENEEENLQKTGCQQTRGFFRGEERTHKCYNVNVVIEAVRRKTDDSCVKAKTKKEKDQANQHPHDTKCPWTLPSETHCEMANTTFADGHLPEKCLSRQSLGFMTDEPMSNANFCEASFSSG